jgi:hypothetical protein
MTREGDIFACLTDAVVAPGGTLPALSRTDAVAFLERYLAASPRRNRVGLRALLLALEVGPLALGFGARLRRLALPARLSYLAHLEHSRAAPLARALEALAKLAYYGDDGVMRELGYDPDAIVERGRRVRREEARW